MPEPLPKDWSVRHLEGTSAGWAAPEELCEGNETIYRHLVEGKLCPDAEGVYPDTDACCAKLAGGCSVEWPNEGYSHPIGSIEMDVPVEGPDARTYIPAFMCPFHARLFENLWARNHCIPVGFPVDVDSQIYGDNSDFRSAVAADAEKLQGQN